MWELKTPAAVKLIIGILAADQKCLDTAVKAMEAFKEFSVIFVSHSTGFSEPNTQKFSEGNRRIVESKGGIVLTTTHAFAGVSRAMRTKQKGPSRRRSQ